MVRMFLACRVVDFTGYILAIEFFFAKCFRFVTVRAFDRQTDRQTDGRMELRLPIPRCIQCNAVKMVTKTIVLFRPKLFV